MRAKNVKQKYEKIKEKKILTKIDHLCSGLPEEFFKYCSYCRRLKFTEKPDYSKLRDIFKNLFNESKFEYDYEYDWVTTS